jgi:hypothetical protein
MIIFPRNIHNPANSNVSNIRKYKPLDFNDYDRPANCVLAEAIGEFEEVVIIGKTKDGEIKSRVSRADRIYNTGLLEVGAHLVRSRAENKHIYAFDEMCSGTYHPEEGFE